MADDFETFFTDAELAKFMQVSPSTIRRLYREGPSGRPGTVDIRLIQPITIGHMRRWPRSRVFAVLGVTE